MNLVRRQILITIGMTFAFIALGFVAAFVITHVQGREMRRDRPSFFARLIDEIAEREKIPPAAAVEWLRAAAEPGGPFTFEVRDAASFEETTARAITSAAPYEGISNFPEAMKLRTGTDTVLIVHHRGPFGAVDANRPGPPGPPGPADAHGPPPPPPSDHHPRPPPWMGEERIFYANFIALVVAILIASTLSVLSLFYTLRGKAQLADHVLSEMKSGNLKARFPITRTDEVGQVMVKFNAMADEIEKLVERIRTTELARVRLLQELAHDLRTPIASLRSVLETLDQRGDRVSVTDRAQLLTLALKETRYFEHLVEDLLFLAQVTDPRYHGAKDRVDLHRMIVDEVDQFRARPSGDRTVAFDVVSSGEAITITGDQRLLRRLVRNALENAFSFATTRVRVTIDSREIVVEDDGPGVSADVIQSFGEKRATRVFTPSGEGRLSVGLGAVIMRAVAVAHGGDARIANVASGQGTRLTITLG